jgi:predicted ferric reductase
MVVTARDAVGIRHLRRIFGGYEPWRVLHRTTGLFVALGFVHGILDGTPLDAAPILRWSFIVIGGIGLAFYVYRELLAQFFLSLHDCQVADVHEVDRGLVEVSLTPLGRPMDFVPGQFAMIYLEAKDGWHRHPSTSCQEVEVRGVPRGARRGATQPVRGRREVRSRDRRTVHGQPSISARPAGSC